MNRPLGFVFGPAPAQTTPSASSDSFACLYDLTNRRIGATATDNSWWAYPATATAVSYTANSLDQYSAIGAVTPTYDGNGNLTYDGTFTYGYDAESRLVSVTQGGTTVATYAYDALGHRKSKTVAATTTIYVTDAANRAVLDYDGSGAVQRWYAFGAGPNEALGQTNVAASTRATFIPDAKGSVVGSLDSSSGAITKAGYQAYGESGSTGGTFRYTGARIDAETSGLYDFRARMYSPVLGRFLQADPIGTQGGMNLYAYVGNDPLNGVDPSGLAEFNNAFSGPSAQPAWTSTVGLNLAQGSSDQSSGQNWLSAGVHGALTAGSFCPSVCGSAFSAIDAAVYAAQGDWTSAGISTAAAGIGLASDAGLAKMAGLGAKAGLEALEVATTGRQVEQYALRAAEQGFYPVMIRGFAEPQAGVFLNAGDVWKFGVTQNPATRYSQTFLTDWALAYDTLSVGTRNEALSAEKGNIMNYLNQMGQLPPGNKIIR